LFIITVVEFILPGIER